MPLFGSPQPIDPTLDAALVRADGHARRQVAKAQEAIRHNLEPGERLLAVGVDIDNLVGVGVVTDRRLLTFAKGRLSAAIRRTDIRGAQLHRLSSCSFVAAIEGAGVQLTFPTEDAARAFIHSLALP